MAKKAKQKELTEREMQLIVRETVDNQLRSGNPPETSQTYDRLLREGHSDKDARLLIGNLVARQIYRVLNSRGPFNLIEFVAELARLPELPDE